MRNPRMKQKLRVFAPGGSVTQMEALAAKIKPQKGRTSVKTCEIPWKMGLFVSFLD